MMLSVVIPVYNVAPYLRECLDSLLAQTCTDWEAVCVDDGSTDGSGAILDEYAAKEHRFIVVHQANRGVSAARNKGLDMAKGGWIGFVDGDDRICPQWLETVKNLIAQYPDAEMVALEGRIDVWENDKINLNIANTVQLSNVYVRHGEAAMAFGLSRYSKEGWSFLNFVRKDFVVGSRFIDGVRIKEDVLFFMELALRLKHIVVARFPGYYYVHRKGSALSGVKRIDDNLRFLDELRRYPRIARRAVSRAAGWDFIHWAHNRKEYSGDDCGDGRLLDKWRSLVGDGVINVSDIYWWWRPGIRRWLKTGNVSWIDKTWQIRSRVEWLAKRLAK